MDNVKKISFETSLDIIRGWPVIQFDTETTGLNAHLCDLVCMQFGYKDFHTGKSDQIIVDTLSIDALLYRQIIESKPIIGHNLKFDLQFLYNYNITPLDVYDTMICEQVLYLGYSKKQVSFNLHDVLLRNTGIELDKSYQKQIATNGLTPEGIIYAANDVKYLQDIRKAQILIAEGRNCVRALTVENRFVPAIAYLEWCGIHLDEDKWKAKMDNDNERYNTTLTRLNDYVKHHTELSKHFVSTATQLDLFETNPDVFEHPVTVDWASPKQVIPVFKTLGFNTEIFDKETHKMRDSVEKKVVGIQKGIDDEFLDIYFDYKEAEKKVSTYGQNYLNLVNPKTGRIHTEFKQIGTVTGRMSSGGADFEDESKKGRIDKDLARYKNLKDDDVRYVNLQNLPARGEEGKITRECFTSKPGNAFISCDYSAEESRVQADVWNEPSLLDAFENGIDTHNLYAKLCFPEELKDVDVKDVKKVRPDLRQAAKSAEFALGYGSDGTAIASSIGMSVEKAKAMVAGILKGMPGMAKYKKNAIKFLSENGYIVINETTGHRVYWPEWPEWKAEADMMDQKFWQDYKVFHKGTGDDIDKKVKRHWKKSKDWFEKNVLNYPIQGGSAVVMKQAGADLFEFVVKHKLFGKVLFCVFVHDELDCECPEELKDDFSKIMQNIMENAAKKYYKRLPIPAESSIGNHWIH